MPLFRRQSILRQLPRYLVSLIALFSVIVISLSEVRSQSNAVGSNDWITMNKDYSSQRYLDLAQINLSNVRALKKVCEAELNEASWYNSGLLMVDRTIYTATLRATYAIDAAICEVRWRSVIKLGALANISTRGPAYLDGEIFRGTTDGRVIALDAKTGSVLWDQQLANPKQHESFVAAPIAWHDKVFIGISISDLAIRGRLIAVDAKTGTAVWRFYMVPEPAKGKPLSGWLLDIILARSNDFRNAGAGRQPRAPDHDLAVRPGKNLYTNSVVALDAETGKLKWYYRQHPSDDHDWDLGSAPTLYRTRSGEDRIAAAGKDGRVVSLDGATKKPVFKSRVVSSQKSPMPKYL